MSIKNLIDSIKNEGLLRSMKKLDELYELAINNEQQVAGLQAERDQLAAECAALNDRMQKLIQIINNADNNYCMCGEAMETHTHGGCGHPTGMFDYHYNAWLEADTETPATDRFLAEQRAKGVDALAQRLEGLVAVSVTQGFIQQFAAQLRNEVKV